MKRYIIVGNGQDDFSSIYQNENDIIIACDGGYEVIKKRGLKPHVLVGDFDSLDIQMISKDISVYKYSTIKDDSDLKLALDICLKMQKDNNEDLPILIYNSTGKRIDHFLACLNVLKEYKNEKIKIIDKHNLVYIKNNDFEIFSNEYKYISFFNIEKETCISLIGFKYLLDNYTMKDNDYLCLSNEIIGKGIVKTNKPIIVIQSKD